MTIPIPRAQIVETNFPFPTTSFASSFLRFFLLSPSVSTLLVAHPLFFRFTFGYQPWTKAFSPRSPHTTRDAYIPKAHHSNAKRVVSLSDYTPDVISFFLLSFVLCAKRSLARDCFPHFVFGRFQDEMRNSITNSRVRQFWKTILNKNELDERPDNDGCMLSWEILEFLMTSPTTCTDFV